MARVVSYVSGARLLRWVTGEMPNNIKDFNYMFNFKKDKIVSCEKCKFLLPEKDAVKIKIEQYDDSCNLYRFHDACFYYCKGCKPAYDFIKRYVDDNINRYYKIIEVKEDGKKY